MRLFTSTISILKEKIQSIEDDIKLYQVKLDDDKKLLLNNYKKELYILEHLSYDFSNENESYEDFSKKYKNCTFSVIDTHDYNEYLEKTVQLSYLEEYMCRDTQQDLQ